MQREMQRRDEWNGELEERWSKHKLKHFEDVYRNQQHC